MDADALALELLRRVRTPIGAAEIIEERQQAALIAAALRDAARAAADRGDAAAGALAAAVQRRGNIRAANEILSGEEFNSTAYVAKAQRIARWGLAEHSRAEGEAAARVLANNQMAQVAADRSAAEAALAEARQRTVDAQMLAYRWMECHDKLKAGDHYELPCPADLPDALAEARATIKRLRSLVRRLAGALAPGNSGLAKIARAALEATDGR